MKIGTIFIKLNKHACFNVSNQGGGMNFCGRGHGEVEKEAAAPLEGGWVAAREEER